MDLISKRFHNDSASSCDCARRMKWDDTDSQSRFHHANNQIGIRRFEFNLRSEFQSLKCFRDMAPPCGTAFIHDEREGDDVSEKDSGFPGKRVSWGSNQAPAHREQMSIGQFCGRLIGGRDSKRDIRLFEQDCLDFLFGPRAQPHMNGGVLPVESFDRVDQNVSDQVLARDHMQVLWSRLIVKQLAQVGRTLEK